MIDVPYRWWDIYTMITGFSIVLFFIACFAAFEYLSEDEPMEIKLKSDLVNCEYEYSVRRDGKNMNYYKCDSGNRYVISFGDKL